jgi:hypothetical protein
MEQKVVLAGVEIFFVDGRVVIVLDKRVVIGSTILFSETHRHEVLGNVTMADGLDALAVYLQLNSWPNISSTDRATLLNVTNAARGANEQSQIQQL